jgi:hypothetical protein
MQQRLLFDANVFLLRLSFLNVSAGASLHGKSVKNVVELGHCINLIVNNSPNVFSGQFKEANATYSTVIL